MKSKFIILLVSVLIFGLGIAVQLHQKNEKNAAIEKPENLTATYKFEPVAVNTNTWKTLTPYAGVSFKYPDSWTITDNGPQKQLSDGSIGTSNESGKYSYFNIIELSSNDLEPKFDRKTQSYLPSELITNGIYILLNVNLSQNASTIDHCSYYSGREVEYFEQAGSKFCQVKLSKNTYAFFITGNKDLRMEVYINDSEDGPTKNYYLSVATEILKSFES